MTNNVGYHVDRGEITNNARSHAPRGNADGAINAGNLEVLPYGK